MIDFNPVTFTAKPKLIDRPPEIFAVDDCGRYWKRHSALSQGSFQCLRLGRLRAFATRTCDLLRAEHALRLADVLEGREEICPGLWSITGKN
jgi:hypothetical protein